MLFNFKFKKIDKLPFNFKLKKKLKNLYKFNNFKNLLMNLNPISLLSAKHQYKPIAIFQKSLTITLYKKQIQFLSFLIKNNSKSAGFFHKKNISKIQIFVSFLRVCLELHSMWLNMNGIVWKIKVNWIKKRGSFKYKWDFKIQGSFKKNLLQGVPNKTPNC